MKNLDKLKREKINKKQKHRNYHGQRFCEYCDCDDCIHGTDYLVHAKTVDGKWICDVCYNYDICQKDSERKGLGPCDDKNCKHRPKLLTKWKKK